MPTAPHAINNSIDILGWTHTIIAGGRRKNSQRYTNWRSDVETKIRAKGWLWKKDAGNRYDAFALECAALDDFPVSGGSIIRRPKTADTEPSHKALNELLLDCFKKIRESQNKRKHAVAREDLEAEANQNQEADVEGLVRAKRPKYDDGRPVVIYVLDPANPTHRIANTWKWNIPGAKKLAVLYEPSLNDLHVKISSHLPDGRKVREIIGALENAADGQDGPADTTIIRSDEDLDAFLRLTESKPIKLLVVLHRLAADGVNTPPPVGSNADKYYFRLGRFDGPEYYADELEDSDEEIANRAGGRGRRGVPRKDYRFEERLEEIRRRIRRQQRLLADLQLKHKATFPEAVHDTDPGGELRVLCYGENDDLTGKQAIIFRDAVGSYLADLAVRTAANNANANLLTDDQVKTAAINAVKADIDADIYPGLPTTDP